MQAPDTNLEPELVEDDHGRTHIQFWIRASGRVTLRIADMEPGDVYKFTDGRLDAADLISEYPSARQQWRDCAELEIDDWDTFTPKEERARV